MKRPRGEGQTPKSRWQPGRRHRGPGVAVTRHPAPLPPSRHSPQAAHDHCRPLYPLHLSPGRARSWGGGLEVTGGQETLGGHPGRVCPEWDWVSFRDGASSHLAQPRRQRKLCMGRPQGRKELAFGFSWDVCLLLGRLGPWLWLLRMRAMMLGWKDRTGLAVGAWGGTPTSGQTSPERLQDPGCSLERHPRACLNQEKGVAATATCAGQAWFEEDPVSGETHTYVRAMPRLETQVRTVAVSRQQCQNIAPTLFHRR